jgi:hypothetical protein
VGWSLISSGSAHVPRPERRTFAILVFAVGLSWFVAEWNNPGVGLADGEMQYPLP